MRLYEIVNTDSLTCKQRKRWQVGTLVGMVNEEDLQKYTYIHMADDTPKYACRRADYKSVILIDKQGLRFIGEI